MPQPEDLAAKRDMDSAAETWTRSAAPWSAKVPPPVPGEVLAERFRITRFIAGGGMGLVFEAFDSEIQERVAVKVIRPELIADEGARVRFLREVQIARKVTHPNVCRTFDVFHHRPLTPPGTTDVTPEVTFLSMELLEGETLADRIGRGKLTTAEAFPILKQVAAALAAAHEAGIVHRDFKSRNVILVGAADAVRAVVTDFGLARGISRDAASLADSGALRGTPAYMAPEQIEGSGTITPAVDVYALGVVLYEMISGRRPFIADTPLQEALARLTDNPLPLRTQVPDLEPTWEATILRCLERNPKDRFASALDVVKAVAGEKAAGSSRLLRRRAGQALLAGSILAVAAAAVIWLSWPQWHARSRYPEIARLNFDSGTVLQAEVSPDGKLLAYVSDSSGNFDIWVQQVGGRRSFQLTHHKSLDWMPSFSRDGSQVAFRSERDGGGIYVVEALGGEERKIAERGWFPRFSPGSDTISYCESAAWFQPSFNRMFLVPAKGGLPKPFQPEFGSAEWPVTYGPVWSPDGRHLLFAGQRGADSSTWEWYVAPVEGGQAVATGALALLQKQLREGIHAPSAWRDDYVYFSSGSSVEGVNIYRIRLKTGTWQAVGPAEQLTSGPGIRSQSSIALGGRLVFAIVNLNYELSQLALYTSSGGIEAMPRRFNLDATAKREPSITHDGRKLLYSSYGGGEDPARLEIRLRDLNTDSERTYFPSGKTMSTYPRIKADGSAFAYSDWIDGERRSYLIEGEAGIPREICKGCRFWTFFNLSGDMIIREQSGKFQKLNPAVDQARDLLLASTLQVLDVSLSWDDAWLVVHAGKPNGGVGLYLVPLRDQPVPENEWLSIIESQRWLGAPRWSPDGSLIYFLAEFDGMCCLYAQRLDRATKAPAGTPLEIFHAHKKPHLMMGFRGSRGLEVARNFIVLVMTDVSGTVWTTEISR